jgi:hypothetical protein
VVALGFVPEGSSIEALMGGGTEGNHGYRRALVSRFYVVEFSCPGRARGVSHGPNPGPNPDVVRESLGGIETDYVQMGLEETSEAPLPTARLASKGYREIRGKGGPPVGRTPATYAMVSDPRSKVEHPTRYRVYRAPPADESHMYYCWDVPLRFGEMDGEEFVPTGNGWPAHDLGGKRFAVHGHAQIDLLLALPADTGAE